MWVYLFYLLFVTAILLVSIFSIEAWPFSSYPMFSEPTKNDSISILYLESELENGERIRWQFTKGAFFQKKMDNSLRYCLKSDKNNIQKLESTVYYFYQLYRAKNLLPSDVKQVHVIELMESSNLKKETKTLFSFPVEQFNQEVI